MTRLLLYFFILTAISFLPSCKKQSKEYITVEWEFVNPVTKEPYVGVPVRLLRQKYGKSNSLSSPNIESEVVFEGESDAYGKASFSFRPYMNSKYGYIEAVDVNYFGVQGVDISIISRPQIQNLDKNKNHYLKYSIVPYAQYYVHTKNIDCQGADDKMRYRLKSIYTNDPGKEFTDWAPSTVVSSGYIEGCYDGLSPLIKNRSDSVIFELEVTKNGITNTFTKKFYRDPTKIDTLKLYY